jgi:hypothetical protein
MNRQQKIALEIGEEALAILAQRSEKYNDENIEPKAHSSMMKMLYPHGISSDEMEEHTYISHIVDKLCRYKQCKDIDNLLDMANYAFLLAALGR